MQKYQSTSTSAGLRLPQTEFSMASRPNYNSPRILNDSPKFPHNIFPGQNSNNNNRSTPKINNNYKMGQPQMSGGSMMQEIPRVFSSKKKQEQMKDEYQQLQKQSQVYQVSDPINVHGQRKPSASSALKKNTNSNELQIEPNMNGVSSFQSKPTHKKSNSSGAVLSIPSTPSATSLQQQIVMRVKEIQFQQEQMNQSEQKQGWQEASASSSARGKQQVPFNSQSPASNAQQLPSSFQATKKNNSILSNFVTKIDKDDPLASGNLLFSPTSPYFSTSTKSNRMTPKQNSAHQLDPLDAIAIKNSKNFQSNNSGQANFQQQQQNNNMQNPGSSNLNTSPTNEIIHTASSKNGRSSSSHVNLSIKSGTPRNENLILKKLEQLSPVQLSQNGNSGYNFQLGMNLNSAQMTIQAKKNKKPMSIITQQQQYQQLLPSKLDGSPTQHKNERSESNQIQIEQNRERANSNLTPKPNQSNNLKTLQVNNLMNGESKINISEPNNTTQQSGRTYSPQKIVKSQLTSFVSSQQKEQNTRMGVRGADEKDKNEEKDTQSCESDASASHANKQNHAKDNENGNHQNDIQDGSQKNSLKEINEDNHNSSKMEKHGTKKQQELNKQTSLSIKEQLTQLKKENDELQGAFKKHQITHHPQTPYYMQGLNKAFKNPYSVDAFAQLFRQHFLQTCQGVLYSNLAKPANPKDLANKKVTLGPRNKKYSKTLVFDMDETLIHCNENVDIPCDVVVDIKFPTGEFIQAGINVRPYAREILKQLSQEFEIIIFTASHVCYAQAVIDFLDPEKKYVHYRFFRDQCIQTPQGVYIKDLRIFSDRKLQDLVLIDNAAYSFSFQVDNGIPIIPFYDNKSDTELLHLVSYLRELHSVPDVRDYNRNHLKMSVFNEPQGPQKVYDNLFKPK